MMDADVQQAGAAAPIWRLVARRGQPIACFNETGTAAAFYCVHPIFGDVTCFHALAQALGPDQPFYGIQVPRRMMQPAFASSIEALARHHVDAVLAFQPEGPLALGGWSAGAIIALEMAQQMHARGREVALLVALDGAPCNTGAGLARRNPLYLLKVACNLPGWFRCRRRQDGSLSHVFSQVAAKISARARMRASEFPSEQTIAGDEIRDRLESSSWHRANTGFIRALYHAMQTYVPAPYAGRVVVFEARVQPLDHLLQVGAAWKKIAAGCEIIRLDGNHEDVLAPPGVTRVARHLQAELACHGRSGRRESNPPR